MKIAMMPCRSAPRGLKTFLGCLLLCLLTCVSASAQEENISGIGGEFYDYAEFSFAVPKELEDMVEAESLSEGNYTEGRYVAASLLFNESRVFILLLYPCDVPEEELDAAGLKSEVEAFNPGYNQTVYSPTPLNISDRSAIGGQLGNQILVAYQPSNQTVSMIFIDENVSEDFLDYFPQSLQITVNESSSPLWPGYCAGAEEEEVEEDVVAVQTEPVPNKEQMEAEIADISKRFEQAFNKQLSF